MIEEKEMRKSQKERLISIKDNTTRMRENICGF